MESTTLQNVTIQTPATFKFKSASLNAYSRQIADIGRDMASKNFELSKILGKVKTEKAYEEDGFKSVSDYAEQTFGIKKSSAYQLATVGERFLNATTPTAKKVAGMLTPSNMAELVKMEDKDIEKAISDGKISAASTQKELRAVADAGKEAKVTVEKPYKVSVTAVTSSNEIRTISFPRTTLAYVRDGLLKTEWNIGGDGAVYESKTVSKSKDSGVELIWFCPSGAFAKIEYSKVEIPVEDKKSKKAPTYDEIAKMLMDAAAREGKDISEILKMAQGKKDGE